MFGLGRDAAYLQAGDSVEEKTRISNVKDFIDRWRDVAPIKFDEVFNAEFDRLSSQSAAALAVDDTNTTTRALELEEGTESATEGRGERPSETETAHRVDQTVQPAQGGALADWDRRVAYALDTVNSLNRQLTHPFPFELNTEDCGAVVFLDTNVDSCEGRHVLAAETVETPDKEKQRILTWFEGLSSSAATSNEENHPSE